MNHLGWRPDGGYGRNSKVNFAGDSVVKNLPANAGDVSLIPASGSFPGQENGDLFQYFCLENPMDRRTLWATVHRVTKEFQIQLRN